MCMFESNVLKDKLLKYCINAFYALILYNYVIFISLYDFTEFKNLHHKKIWLKLIICV